ncbi:mediator-associated protein 2 [Tripterygium wilfordii]|uniref:Mediator-associated protein 2 n=1 Tax=Tripterygium wilfordii TaxID=458696 RepID=A0A7J7D4E6_TRIWF|nr:mediator-associated protein 2 [Tripterygium wilfordii]
MHGAEEEGYEPSKEFEEDTKEPLVDLELTDSTDLWLIQWPSNQAPDFDGKEVTLNLNQLIMMGAWALLRVQLVAIENFIQQNIH